MGQEVTAAALTVVSMIASPVHDLGRIVEHRQSYRAACRSIAPALGRRVAGNPEGSISANSTGLVVAGLDIGGTPVPELAAGAGETILLHTVDHAHVEEIFHALLGAHPAARVVLNGKNVFAMSPGGRRQCLGYAARGLALERGQLRRAVRYRCPDADDAQFAAVIDRAGLGKTIARLPKGALTMLRRGGEPLSTPERAKVHLARATLGNPPLLLLNHIDADLDAHSMTALRDILTDYPGIVLAATDNPSLLPHPHRIWPAERHEPLSIS